VSTSISPWLITGLVEGAGSFTYQRNGPQLTLVFALRLPAGGRPVLELLRDYFGGAGRIYTTEPRRTGAAAPQRALRLRVTRPAELLRVVQHFDRYPLRGSERRSFGTWREMVLLRAANMGRRPPEELRLLAERLTRERGEA
jgi:hypothetical protein